MTGDQLGLWFTAHKTEALGGAAAVVVAYALYQRKKNAAATAAAASSPATTTAGLSGTPDTALTDQGNYFQDQLNQLQGQLYGLTAGAGAPSSTPATTGNGSGIVQALGHLPIVNKAGDWIVQGKLDQVVNLRQFAQSTLDPIQQNNRNAVEARLRQIVAANPDLAGKTTVLGGHAITVPASIQTAAAAPRTGSSVLAQRAPLSKPQPLSAPSYVVPRGGTLAGAATALHGDASPASVQAVAQANRIPLYQRSGVTLAQVYPGQVLKKG